MASTSNMLLGGSDSADTKDRHVESTVSTVETVGKMHQENGAMSQQGNGGI